MFRNTFLTLLSLAWLALVALMAGTAAHAEPAPDLSRRDALVRMVRQDCGSCHGMRLTGGLGPPLTPAALAGKPLSSMAATIHAGRPGTPMPGWRAMLSADEAAWIAERLADGFPEELR
jgi:cytochrome c55X